MEKISKQAKLNEDLSTKMQYLTDQLLRLKKQMDKIERGTPEESGSNIILFPSMTKKKPEPGLSGMARLFIPAIYHAKPGKTLPMHIPDFRNELQRDGLILLSWDWRLTENGGQYTAYWVTSSDTPRYYASKPVSLANIASAHPDHKSYAAEDGIEFYGQSAPAYMVHVAPELMMSSPGHAKLRQKHIKALKQLGSKIDFEHKYLLKNQRRKKQGPKDQAG
ncbi:MAG: hypothetical protein FWG77_02935 [Treponema sp.]|nr:hypothetical protein [Treponema sp.]